MNPREHQTTRSGSTSPRIHGDVVWTPADEIRRSISTSVSEALEKRELGYGVRRAVERIVGLGGYRHELIESAPFDALAMWSGCGDPLAWCDLSPGQSVLELGCGAGLDLVLAARRVAPDGFVMGVDMNEDACLRALSSVKADGLRHAEVRQGLAEELATRVASVDVVISNGVLSLSPEKGTVLAAARQALAPGGWFVAAEVALEVDLPPWLEMSRGLRDVGITGAAGVDDYLELLTEAGFEQVEAAHKAVLEPQQLEDLIDRGMAGLEVAGCSASGAIMGSEVAALLSGTVAVVTLRARAPASQAAATA